MKTVSVKAHTRNGKTVRASTRKLPSWLEKGKIEHRRTKKSEINRQRFGYANLKEKEELKSTDKFNPSLNYMQAYKDSESYDAHRNSRATQNKRTKKLSRNRESSYYGKKLKGSGTMAVKKSVPRKAATMVNKPKGFGISYDKLTKMGY